MTISQSLKLTPHESVTVREHNPGQLVVEAVYTRGGRSPPVHLHPEQDERFEIMAGRLRVDVDGQERELGPGAIFVIPRGTPHKMWNVGDEPVRAIWTTIPAGRTHEWFTALDRLQREGRVNRDGMPPLLVMGIYLTTYRDVFRLAGPQWLLRPVLATLAMIGRWRGYEVPSPGRGVESSAQPGS
ncbi:cupin domain-containing protein [Bradyrhizobium sp. LTSPM299]|uniref:cupin domain-containing protein n=1 Tax=Bradyrhizobium sp. LTSPM299 TaxID=1619233 RepID=UPI0009E2E4D7|nr:cupin domain-containing protein [Bradyrhizobium sp. LTSPM299]